MFIVAASTKLLRRDLSEVAKNAFLTRGLSVDTGVRIWRGVGVVELGIVVLLILDQTRRVAGIAVLGFAAVAVAYTVAALVQSGEPSNCGCLAADEPASWRSVGRAAALVLIGVGVAARPNPSFAPTLNLRTGLLVACEIAALLLLTPEAAPHRIINRVRSRHVPGCLTSRHSLEWTLAMLRRSELWIRVQQYLLDTAVVDQWRDGCWRFVVFPAQDGGRSATAVLAIKLPPGRIRIRGAIVPDDATLPVTELVERYRGRRTLRWAAAKAAFVMAGAFVCASSLPGASAATSRLLIIPGRSVGPVSLGESRAQLETSLGRPHRVLRYRGALGTRVDRYIYERLTADLSVNGSVARVIRVFSTSSLARTASGIGVGVNAGRIRRVFPSSHCRVQTKQPYCQLGNPDKSGSRFTTFFLAGAKVRSVLVALAVNT